MRKLLTKGLAGTALLVMLNGCAVVAVADAAVSVVATTVKVGASVVGTGVDVASSGIKAATGSDNKDAAN